MRSLEVRLADRTYPIVVGEGVLSRVGPWIKERRIRATHVLIVSQKEILAHHGNRLLSSLKSAGFETTLFIPPASKNSEAAKSEKVFWKLIKTLSALDGKGRAPLLLAFGGGVVGDLTGFAAAVYRRGIPYVQVPTTVTAQVDSAIGGKTAIDLPEGKNLLGSIYQPCGVLSDIGVLESLPDRHWSDGFAEVIKYGIIEDASLFATLYKEGMDGVRKNKKLLEKIIFRCAEIKARIVEKDELDKKGIRIALNFGHTLGHAIEAASGFSNRYTHGESVGIGMLAACDISEKLGLLRDKGLRAQIEKVLVRFQLPLFYKGLSLESLLRPVGYDKKSEGGKNRFVLPIAMGKMTIAKDVPADVIKEALLKRKS